MRFASPSIRRLLAASALIAGSATAAAQSNAGSMWHGAGTVVPVNAASEPVYGPSVSDFSVIVWIDPECPYCKMLGRAPEAAVDASGGQVNLAVRLLPLPNHGRAAFMSAATALCVNQQSGAAGYYRFLGRYMDLTRTNGAGLPDTPATSLEALAREAGATDMAKLDACIHSPETIRTLGDQFEAATAAAVTGTPAIAVRDNRSGTVTMTEGAISADDISQQIRRLGARSAN